MAITEDQIASMRLVCPKCKGTLVLLPDASGLDCQACKLRYPIEDDIPNMLISEARPLQ